jgi:hypothetical protein
MKLESQQHQHKSGNIQHKYGITTTSARSWKSSTKVGISTTLHEAGNI